MRYFNTAVPSFSTGTLNCAAKRSGLREFVARRNHLPIAADRLVHLHHNRRFLVIAQRDFVLHFPHVRIDLLVVGLLALAHHVERVADMHRDILILRRVLDAVFANKEHAAARIFLVHAEISCRQRHA